MRRAYDRAKSRQIGDPLDILRYLDGIIEALDQEGSAETDQKPDGRGQEHVVQHLWPDWLSREGRRLGDPDGIDRAGLGQPHLLLRAEELRVGELLLGEHGLKPRDLGRVAGLPAALDLGGSGGEVIFEVGNCLADDFPRVGLAEPLLPTLGDERLGDGVGEVPGEGRVGVLDREFEELRVADSSNSDLGSKRVSGPGGRRGSARPGRQAWLRD